MRLRPNLACVSTALDRLKNQWLPPPARPPATASCSSSTGTRPTRTMVSAPSAAFELLEGGKAVDMGGERLEVEGTQQQRGRQLLHGIDEHQQSGRAQRRQQQRHVHPPQSESVVSPSVRAAASRLGERRSKPASAHRAKRRESGSRRRASSRTGARQQQVRWRRRSGRGRSASMRLSSAASGISRPSASTVPGMA